MAQTVELGMEGSPRAGPGPDPLLGQHLLHYRVVEAIGQGGMSVVYRGHDENLHRDVAIKVLHPFLAEKTECRQRLAREARAVARLEHPHILKVFDFSGDPDTIDEKPGSVRKVRGFAEGFIVTELVRGATLKRFAEEHELWQCPEVGAMVVWQIAAALQHAHEHGVVHRDLKPENVMVRDDGWLKLMDFGIAHIADQKGLTITGTLLGSPAHMAPECIDGHPADERSDIFSLGTVLYWLTTGSLPFEALTPHALLKQIVEGRAVPAQQRSPRISDDLGRVLAKSMALKPADRFESAGAFAQALGDCLDRSGAAVDANKLRVILAQPGREVPLVTASVRSAFLARAEQFLADSASPQWAPARALACLNRVLAEDKDDAFAKALLERAQDAGGTETTGDDDVVPALIPPASPVDASALQAGLTSSTTTLPPESPPLKRVARQVGLIVLAAALIGGAVALALRFDDSRVRDSGRDSGRDVVRTDPPAEPVAPVDDGFERGAPAQASEAASKIASKPVATPKARPKLAAVEPVKVDAPVVASKRSVAGHVTPFADVYVDDVLVPPAGRRGDFVLDLAPGKRHITFKKKASSRDIDVVVDVPTDGPAPSIPAVEMKPALAYVIVHCNVKDALVTVNGKGARTAAETEKTKLAVQLKGWQEDDRKLEIVVAADHFVTHTEVHTFVPGQTDPIDVSLTPE